MPAASVPVTSQIRGEFGNHDQVICAWWDRQFTSRAEVGLAGGVGLDGDNHLVVHRQPPATAQATAAIVRISAPTTSATSRLVFCCSRNGLKPTTQRYRGHAGLQTTGSLAA